MPPCHCSHAKCNGADISVYNHRKHQAADEKAVRLEARKANRVHTPANDLLIHGSNLTLSGNPSPISSDQRIAHTHFETSVPLAEIKSVRPTLDEREATRVRELYQSLVDIDTELHEHLDMLANTARLPLDTLLAEEAWFQGTLQRLQAVKTDDRATTLVLTSVIDNITSGLKDVLARKEEIEKASEVNKNGDIYNTGGVCFCFFNVMFCCSSVGREIFQ
jgi:hypothetical protein